MTGLINPKISLKEHMNPFKGISRKCENGKWNVLICNVSNSSL